MPLTMSITYAGLEDYHVAYGLWVNTCISCPLPTSSFSMALYERLVFQREDLALGPSFERLVSQKRFYCTFEYLISMVLASNLRQKLQAIILDTL